MTGTGLLDGIKVLDLTTIIMGPFASQILAGFGCEVIKVEPPGGDSVRDLGPSRNPGMGPLFLQANSGKRSVVLNLKSVRGRAALLRLVSSCDVLVTNFRPQALERLSLDWETLSVANPKIIFATLSGYGSTGLYSRQPAYDDLIQGAAGVPMLNVAAGAGAPRYVPLTIADRVAGLWAANGILAALMHREKTGLGQVVELSMFEAMAHLVLADHAGGRLFDPSVGPVGYQRLLSSDRRPYPTKDGYVCVMIYSDPQWKRFLITFRRDDLLLDPRFTNLTARTAHIDEVYAMVAEEMAARTTVECIRLLELADVAVTRLNTIESLFDDPHLNERNFFEEVDHPTEGKLRLPSPPLRFSRGSRSPIIPAPLLGEHSVEVFTEAGLSPDEIGHLMIEAAAGE